jgi:tetratricopeptide (TPR) repeat protein
VGNIFEGVADSGVPSVSDSEKRISENPRDAQAFRDLATGHLAEGNTDEAIAALENFVALRPKNVDALRELAGLYLAQAGEAQQAANIANTRAAFIAPGAAIASTLQLDGKPLDTDAISTALNTELSQAISTALGEAQQASAQAVATYKKIVAAAPNDPNVQLELAQAAESAGDTATAITAYKAFIRIAPDDPTVPEVRRIVKALRVSSSATG